MRMAPRGMWGQSCRRSDWSLPASRWLRGGDEEEEVPGKVRRHHGAFEAAVVSISEVNAV